MTRNGGVLREQCDLQQYRLSAAGLSGLVRGGDEKDVAGTTARGALAL